LSTSDIKSSRIAYIIGTVFCIIFAAIYEYFSHEVYSKFMILAFLFPLVGGVGAELLTRPYAKRKSPIKYLLVHPAEIYAGGIIILTMGSIFNGVLEIYGTTNRLSIFYWIAGAVLLLIGVLRLAIPLMRHSDK